ncbi:DUF3999 family protein [Flavihumibacter sp. UBA7668]|uniref:DUF3999 family protein n=1 Tax=Flavihumibacter sp. UBA7668 TaxID=1946542 RepID=UPI0025BDB01E|nr:DUF3999 family protein [Flavihumibacter sp. UBA7668]
MNWRIKVLILVFTLGYLPVISQINTFQYKRELEGITSHWHKIQLPDDIFQKLKNDYSDIRIYGLTPNKDTVEAPYLVRKAADQISNRTIDFKTINQASNENGFYFTFEIPTAESVNQFQLEFKQPNFDWRIKLEGSQNQQDWFTIVRDYRILSIKNESIDFQFTTLNFPDSKYRFLRLSINSPIQPELVAASIINHQMVPGNSRSYPLKEFTAIEKKDTKQTILDLMLEYPVPVSSLEIKVKDSFDYYRPITIQYQTDSVKLEKDWIYNYQTLLSGTLNSFENKQWEWESRLVQKLKIIIDNQDNQILSIGGVVLKGYVHELLTRFTVPGTYALYYGNSHASGAIYDLQHFKDKVPVDAQVLNLGAELSTMKKEPVTEQPLFTNKWWLWIVMGSIIVLLAGFTFTMIKKK